MLLVAVLFCTVTANDDSQMMDTVATHWKAHNPFRKGYGEMDQYKFSRQ